MVSRHYLGSINHTLLTLDRLLADQIDVALVFVGDPHPTTESIISIKTGVPVLGRIPMEPVLNKEVVRRHAGALLTPLKSWLA